MIVCSFVTHKTYTVHLVHSNSTNKNRQFKSAHIQFVRLSSLEVCIEKESRFTKTSATPSISTQSP